MQFEGKVVLVTGGSAGIGLALTRQLAAKGASVIICGRNQARLNDVCSGNAGMVTGLAVDLADPQAVDAFCRTVVQRHPDLSLVINNAGIQEAIDFFSENEPDVMARARGEVEINFNAVMALCHGLMPLLGNKPEAGIVNISSGLGLVPKRSAPVYCASKAAIRSFTKALRYQARASGSNIRVTDAVMTLVETGMTAGRGKGKISPDEAARAVLNGIERGRDEIWVGKTKLLRLIYRLSPSIAEAMLKNG